MPHTPPRYYTVTQVATRLATSPRTIRNWINQGVRPNDPLHNVKLRAMRFGRSWRIRSDDLASFEAALAELG